MRRILLTTVCFLSVTPLFAAPKAPKVSASKSYSTNSSFKAKKPPLAGSTFTDKRGRYTGRISDNGYKSDALGRYTGRIDNNGRIYDAKGRYSGQIKLPSRP